MGKKKSRKAGDRLKNQDYGDWSDSWQKGVEHQQLYASGSYDKDSELAKKFATLNTDGKSRVDDEEGWSELSFDKPIKSAADYEELVNKWSAAGFDVRAIDMKTKDGRAYGNSNIAVRIADGSNPAMANLLAELLQAAVALHRTLAETSALVPVLI